MPVTIPKHLEKNVTIVDTAEDTLVLKMYCDCGSVRFDIFKNYIPKTDELKQLEKKYWEYSRFSKRGYNVGLCNDGHWYAYRKNIFGFPKDKLNIDLIMMRDNTDVFRGRCTTCGKEFVIFDSRYHGYNSMAATVEEKEKKYNFKQIRNAKDTGILVEIIYEDTYEKFLESYPNADMDMYSNAFSWIEISTVDEGKKSKIIFTEEVG